jgi:hypothetical protein
MLLWLAGALATFLTQSGRIWYYAIPLLLPATVWASQCPHPYPLAGAAAAALLLLARTHLTRSLDTCVWRFHGSYFAERNEALARAAKELREIVRGRTVLVAGRWNQAYVLLDASYETPLISPAPWLKEMAPGWRTSLNEQMLRSPPDFLLDSEEVFDPEAARSGLGLDYRLERSYPPSFRLFRLAGSEPPGGSTDPTFLFPEGS